jgi:glycosyltransferase involved in cell wall biosynthesis
MHPYFPSRLHYRLAKTLEDSYARRADAVVYVSETNLDAVRARIPEDDAEKLHLVRYGADSILARAQPTRGADFEIVYVGAMSGWWTLIGEQSQSQLKRIYRGWARLGRYSLTSLDQRTSSPAIIGRAILDAIAAHADWAGRVKLTIYGNPYSASVVARALESAEVDSVVDVFDPVPHDEVADLLARADLLFLTLPRRVDGSRGGRISAKTYEYLMTDRPILAAVPRGENWDYLAGRPGVWLVEPDDERSMREVISELAAAKFAGEAHAFDREGLREQLSYDGRAAELASVIRAGIERAATRSKRRHAAPRA